MTARHTLKALHERLAASHQRQAAFHSDSASCLEGMSACTKAELSDDDELRGHLEDFATRHKDQAEFHKGEAAYHRGQVDSLNDASKAAGGDFEKLAPLREGLHAFPLEFQDATRPNIRAVIRPGQPELGKGSDGDVPEEFAKLVSLDLD